MKHPQHRYPPPPTGVRQVSAVLDRTAALDRVGGDLELLQEVSRLFLEHADQLLRDIYAAAAHRDARALEASAHSLKGSVSSFGAEPVFQAAFALEMMGRQQNFANLQEALSALAETMEELRPALQNLADEGAA